MNCCYKCNKAEGGNLAQCMFCRARTFHPECLHPHTQISCKQFPSGFICDECSIKYRCKYCLRFIDPRGPSDSYTKCSLCPHLYHAECKRKICALPFYQRTSPPDFICPRHFCIKCSSTYSTVPEVACKYCCITMHLTCIPHPETFDPTKPYICPRHPIKPKTEPSHSNYSTPSKTVSGGLRLVPSNLSPKPPSIPPAATYSPGMTYSTVPGYRLSPTSIYPQPFPHHVPSRSLYKDESLGHEEKKEEKKDEAVNQDNAVKEEAIAGNKELLAEMASNLAKAVDQHIKKGRIEDDVTSENEEDEWKRLDGNDLYTLAQNNIKKRLKKFGKRFKANVKKEDAWECEDVSNFRAQMRGVAKLLGYTTRAKETKQKVMERCRRKFEEFVKFQADIEDLDMENK